jgi:SAM-dependent methyltransferase
MANWRAPASRRSDLSGSDCPRPMTGHREYDAVVSGTTEVGKWPEDWLRLNAVCPYYTMFPLDFPLGQLMLYPDARRVLDPFCGRGTTLYAARLAGRQAFGIDINPVAVAIARAKTAQASPAAVVRLARRILRDVDDVEIPQGEFWEWAFHPDTLREVVALRDGLWASIDTPTAQLLRALLLGVLHGPRNKGAPSYLSNQMPRTYASKPAYAVRYWHKHGLWPVRVDTVDVIKRRARRVLNDCPPRMPGRVMLGDAAASVMALRQRFDLVITSPPYYGMRTYVADQWLRNWFVGGPPEVPYGSEGQLARQPNQAAFVSALAEVWRAVASRCTPKGHLVIRFGALPSAKVSPEKLIVASLREAGVGWLVRDVRPVGVPSRHRRQAEQFNSTGRVVGCAVNEIDVMAELVPTCGGRRPQ